VLNNGHMHTALPVQDVARARAFYADKLGLEPAAENPGGLLYRLDDGAEFLLYPSSYRPGGHTQANISVPDVRTLVAELRARGLVFEDYDLPGLTTVDGVAASGTHVNAWFKDSEGNLIGLIETRRALP
jgi:catechol 2,3-dioxygenase-like lactoylglutathione lyase family enzyme